MFGLDRLAEHLYANLNGYFWLPCPRCGRYFGGHEWRDTVTCSVYKGRGYGACCAKVSEEADAKACARVHKERG